MPHAVSGYVLAGGKSSRMGRDKALLELGGRPLVALAVEKLRAVCAEVRILSSRPELAEFAPLVPDVHPGCGPLGGIEAALLDATCAWRLFLPVDMPFVRAEFLEEWRRQVLLVKSGRVALFTVGERPQPTLCLLHREVTPFVQQAVERGEFKLYPVLAGAARSLAAAREISFEEVLLTGTVPDGGMFANVNTPDEFAEAERMAGVTGW